MCHIAFLFQHKLKSFFNLAYLTYLYTSLFLDLEVIFLKLLNLINQSTILIFDDFVVVVDLFLGFFAFVYVLVHVLFKLFVLFVIVSLCAEVVVFQPPL